LRIKNKEFVNLQIKKNNNIIIKWKFTQSYGIWIMYNNKKWKFTIQLK